MRLTVTDLAAERGGRTIFADLSFVVAERGLLAVTGPNGAGKSTLLRVIAGLLTPSAGTVAFDTGAEAMPVHYLGHADGLKTALTVEQNLTFWQRVWGGGDIETALARVGLVSLAGISAGALSAGQRRRVAIARLLLAQRPLWLLDEPATALDADAEATLGTLIGEHVSAGGLAVVATHRPLPLPPTATLALGGA
jgi:heme exporter protein A